MSTNPQKRARFDFAPHVDDQWQSQHSTLAGAFSHLFMNDLFADIRLVPLKNSASPPKKFPAHKLLLRIRSPVFSAMFHYDNDQKVEPKKIPVIKKVHFADEVPPLLKRPRMDEQSSTSSSNNNEENKIQEIRLPDFEPDAFEQFLRFLYTDEGTITGENARPILEIATFYSVRFVEERCRDFIVRNLSPENVGETLKFFSEYNYPKIREQICQYLQTQISPENSLEWFESAHQRGHQELAEMAMEVARDCAALVIQSKAFFGASQKTLECFASQPRLTIDEKTLFNALLFWARQVRRQNLSDLLGKSLRELLGPVLSCVHFWHMTKQQFTETVQPSELLSPMEIEYVLNAIENGGVLPFSRIIESKRKPFVKSGKIVSTLKNALEFAKTKGAVLESEPIVVFGLPWQLRVLALDSSDDDANVDDDDDIFVLEKGDYETRWKPERLAFYIRCNGDAQHKHWKCHASVLFRVLRAQSHKDEKEVAECSSGQQINSVVFGVNGLARPIIYARKTIQGDRGGTGPSEVSAAGNTPIEQSLVVDWYPGEPVPREEFLASNKIDFVDILCPEKGFLDTARNNTIRVEVEIGEAPPPPTKREFYGGDDETASNASDSSNWSTRVNAPFNNNIDNNFAKPQLP